MFKVRPQTLRKGEIMVILSLSLLITCSYTDLRERGISLALLAAFSTSCAVLLISILIFGDRYGFLKKSLVYEPSIINILSGLIPGFLLLLISRIFKESVGMGDVYVVMLLGLMLGFEKTFTILFVSMLMTAAFGLICMAFGRRNRKDSLPYIPFLLGAFTFIFTADHLRF